MCAQNFERSEDVILCCLVLAVVLPVRRKAFPDSPLLRRLNALAERPLLLSLP